jgi:hypothetical protein
MDAQTQLNEAVALLIGNLTIENQALKLQLQATRALLEQLQPKQPPPP